jgi:hypothetical protein
MRRILLHLIALKSKDTFHLDAFLAKFTVIYKRDIILHEVKAVFRVMAQNF